MYLPNNTYTYPTSTISIKTKTTSSTAKLHTSLLPNQIQSKSNQLSLRACIDSAASCDMIPQPQYFESLTYYDTNDPTTPTVMLGDETTKVPVTGYDRIRDGKVHHPGQSHSKKSITSAWFGYNSSNIC